MNDLNKEIGVTREVRVTTLNDCMVEFRNVANFDAVWLPRWRRAGVRANTAKKSKKKSVPTTFLNTAVRV